jgi:F-type H+-transporting ATPase subunit delta
VTVRRTAEVYGRLAFETAAASNQLERWRADLRAVSLVPADDLTAWCARREAGEAGHGPLTGRLPSVGEFVCLLVARARVHLLAEIADAYDRVLDEHYGLAHAEVVSAVRLDGDMVRAIEQRLSELGGRKFVIKARVDPSIIGGLVIQVGDTMVDRSVRARLSRLRLDLLASYETAR